VGPYFFGGVDICLEMLSDVVLLEIKTLLVTMA
jgi:hypothetical protein